MSWEPIHKSHTKILGKLCIKVGTDLPYRCQYFFMLFHMALSCREITPDHPLVFGIEMFESVKLD